MTESRDRPSGRRRGEAIEVAGHRVAAGDRAQFEVPAARLPTGTWLSLPVAVVNGARGGRRVWLSGAIHGDEINGVEIIRRVLPQLDPAELRGTVIAVPIVNVFGFIEQSRYLPDRRDLNRSFPGSSKGSLASRLAHLLMTEVVSKCEYGIDLHTGSNHRVNLPQIRGDMHDPETRRCAEAFGAPVMIHARLRDGSLREAAAAQGISTLLFEGGESLRFDRHAIEVGERGILQVMAALGMVKARRRKRVGPSRVAETTKWVRARRSGLLELFVELGDRVRRGSRIGAIRSTFGEEEVILTAPLSGMVIGAVTNPMVSQGDAIVNLGVLTDPAPEDGREGV